jgi:glycosyltransferase involved in cell wall biosynthesis
MRVLHTTTFLQGGAGRNIADLALAQRRAGHDVRVAADAGGEAGYASYPEYLDALTAAGIPCTLLTSTFKRDVALNARAARELQDVTRAWRPDVVHAHATTPALVARLAGVGVPGRLLHTMHGWGIAKTAAHAAADIALLELADAVVVPSAAAAETLRGAGLTRGDLRVIPYGIAPGLPPRPPDPEDVRAIERSAAGRRVCLCIGTIGERKNQRLLIDALAAAPLRDVTAVFIGDGDAAGLRAHARALGVETRAVVLGQRADASRYLSLAGALVLPSRNEGLPLAVLESLRAGVPVVAADIPEIAEALDGGRCGHLFAPDDAASLGSALRAAFDEPAPARARLRSRFAEHYAEDRMLSAYARLYEALAA